VPGASRFSLAGDADVVALAPWYEGPAGNPAVVLTSVDDRPFGTPIQLDTSSNPPAVGVDSTGDVLATWTSHSSGGIDTQKLSISWHGGPFSTPQPLDLPANPTSTSTIHTIGTRSLITSEFDGLFVNS
jgi:hypothetical protein